MNTETSDILLSFDFGMKRIGVAVGQTITQTARPLPFLKANDGNPDPSALLKLIKTWRPSALIVGIPLNMDGTDQTITHLARQFAAMLKDISKLPVYEIDERLTTKAARERLFEEGGYKALQKGHIDSVAAQIMLENWLNETRIKK